jgi:hypothetical protein
MVSDGFSNVCGQELTRPLISSHTAGTKEVRILLQEAEVF